MADDLLAMLPGSPIEAEIRRREEEEEARKQALLSLLTGQRPSAPARSTARKRETPSYPRPPEWGPLPEDWARQDEPTTPPSWAMQPDALPQSHGPQIGPTPEPTWGRTALEWMTGYPAERDREVGPFETLTSLAGTIPAIGPASKALRAGKTLSETGSAGEGAVRLLADAAKAVFPRLDAYTKPIGPMSRAVILKRIEAAPDLAPEIKTALVALADQVGERRVLPAELHALAAGEKYKPERVLRKVKAPVEGAKQITGAPLGVGNARQEGALRKRYIKGMEKGASGRDWYHDTGRDILFAANDDPERARLVAGDMAITSPTTSVGANAGFGVKGYNQATAGVPVVAGRYPTAMGKSVEALHAGGEASLGLKRDPFAQNIARGGGFLEVAPDVRPRAVHDIWDAEMHGFVNPDGTPMRTGFGPAQHRWMDQQQDKILATANQRATGGFTNWEELRSQAAAWTGAKIAAGQVDPKDAAKHFGDYFEELVAQGSREVTPGSKTAHMPELLRPENAEFRQLYHEAMMRESGIYDQQMRDQISAGFGGLQGRSFDAPGVYKGEVTPGRQTQVLTGSLEAPGGPKGKRVMDEGSRRILDASEATHGVLMGQDASAYSRVLPAGSGAPRTGWDVTLPGGTITNEQMRALVSTLGPGVNDMALIPTPDGIRLGFMDAATAKKAVKQLGGKVKLAGSFEGNLIENNWLTQPQGQGYWEAIRKMGTEKFDATATPIAAKLRDIDARFAKETGGRFTLSPAMDEVRAAIANEGFAGLEKLAKKYGISAMALAAALTELQGAQSPGPTASDAGIPQ